MKTGGLGIVDGNLDTIKADILTRPWCKRICPDEDPAVAALADLEVKRKHEVSPGPLMNQHVATATVWVQAAVLDRAFTGLSIACLPTFRAFAVEEQDPASRSFRRQLACYQLLPHVRASGQRPTPM